MPISLIIAIVLLIGLSAWLALRFNQRHKVGQDAPQQTVKVMVLDKQSIDIPDAQPGKEDQEYWIYVQKLPVGPKREFKVGIHYYGALNPGDRGELTYQGDKFLHFALQRQS
ncbi:DUF2500 domain-containing protein [Vibrio gangliei]|uniref:DUF2500 domain-containing protein n=1 Tax=Vibrio gangliei TaxID=2077090 RepID=UPI000D0165F1|nr:DUF2500 domain-containing protein [Vibrio gangliei]